MEKIAELERRTRKTALRCHRLFAETIQLGDPLGRFRQFTGPVVVNELLNYRPATVEVTQDPQGKAGVWGVRLAYCQEIITQAVLYPLSSKDVFVEGDQTARGRVDLKVFEYGDQVVLDPFAELEPLGEVSTLELVETKLVTGEHSRGIELPPGATDPATLERVYAAQRFCLQWLGCVGRQLNGPVQ